ncbi:helix-turn-helix domain-containing protein [Caballeronia sp. INML3]|jgi:transcriptional regulator with GAF, ATPase, and Fis domain|uniref:helix-turn-helix domain-containing protein n=1 Tax=Caballeronia sp. INML3 TaxID=2921752 RepID=UPI0039062E88
MNTTGTMTMSMHELDRLRVIQAVAERQLKPGRAAERLHVSVRQIERLVMRYRADGARGLTTQCTRALPAQALCGFDAA